MKKLLLLSLFSTCSICLLSIAGAAAESVAADAYQEQALVVEPSSACIGGTVRISGMTMAGQGVDVGMGDVAPWGENHVAQLGKAFADESGAWELTTTIPYSIYSVGMKAEVPMFSGSWRVGAGAGATTPSYGNITVLDCYAQGKAYLPETGLGNGGAFILLTACSLGAGALVLVWGLSGRSAS